MPGGVEAGGRPGRGVPDRIERNTMHPIRRVTVGAALVAIVATGCSNASAGPAWTYAPPPPADAAGSPAAAPEAAAPAVEASSEVIAIEAFDLGFTPATVTVPAAG